MQCASPDRCYLLKRIAEEPRMVCNCQRVMTKRWRLGPEDSAMIRFLQILHFRASIVANDAVLGCAPTPYGRAHPDQSEPHSRHVPREAGRLGAMMAGETHFATLGLCGATKGIGP